MFFLHVIVQLNPAGKSFRRLVKMADNFSVLDLRPRTVVGLDGLLVVEDVHTDRTVGKLLLRVPGVEMCHQVVLLVEVERADKTPELRLFLVMRLDVGQQEVGRRELLAALWTRGLLQLLAVLLTQVLVIGPFLLEDLVTDLAGKTLLHMKLLVLFQLTLRGESFITDRTKIIKRFCKMFFFFCIF